MIDEDDFTALKARVQRLEDREEICNLRMRFALAGDPETKLDKFLELFTDDVVLRYSNGFGEARGKDEIAAFLEVDPVNCRHHMFVPIRIDIAADGRTATAKWYLLECAKGRIPGTEENKPIWVAAVYDDEYVKVDGQWLISAYDCDLRIFCLYENGWTTPVDLTPFTATLPGTVQGGNN